MRGKAQRSQALGELTAGSPLLLSGRMPICGDKITVKISVVDPDPHGSGTFAWIRNFCLDPDPELLFRIQIQLNMKEQINKNVISL